MTDLLSLAAAAHAPPPEEGTDSAPRCHRHSLFGGSQAPLWKPARLGGDLQFPAGAEATQQGDETELGEPSCRRCPGGHVRVWEIKRLIS